MITVSSVWTTTQFFFLEALSLLIERKLAYTCIGDLIIFSVILIHVSPLFREKECALTSGIFLIMESKQDTANYDVDKKC